MSKMKYVTIFFIIIASQLIADNLYAETVDLDTREKISKFSDRWHGGAGYNTGWAFPSKMLEKEKGDYFLDLPPHTPVTFNSVEFSIYYSNAPYYAVAPKYVLQLSYGYMWARAYERQPNIGVPDGFLTCKNVRWDVLIIPLMLEFQRVNGNKFWGLGIEKYYCNSTDIAIAKGGGIDETFTIKSRGCGFGGRARVGLKPPSSTKTKTCFSLLLRVGEINENWNDAAENIKWTPAKIMVTGIYLDVEFEILP